MPHFRLLEPTHTAQSIKSCLSHESQDCKQILVANCSGTVWELFGNCSRTGRGLVETTSGERATGERPENRENTRRKEFERLNWKQIYDFFKNKINRFNLSLPLLLFQKDYLNLKISKPLSAAREANPNLIIWKWLILVFHKSFRSHTLKEAFGKCWLPNKVTLLVGHRKDLNLFVCALKVSKKSKNLNSRS